MPKVGRPRHANPSPDAVWKRNQREKGSQSGSCARCGKTSGLNIHHKNGETSDNRPANLTRLCNSCHLIRHPEIAAKGGKAS